MSQTIPSSSHWGAFGARVEHGRMVAAVPHPADPNPSPLLGGVASAVHHRSRIARPAVRRGWLAARRAGDPALDRSGRGDDEFVEVDWDVALGLVADELGRVRGRYGNEAIFGGSYGWASAGRFHHAQGQLHRLLNLAGGYVASVNTYSTGCSAVLLRHVVGSADAVFGRASSWPTIAEHTDLVVAFGGMPSKNVSVVPGGVTTHRTGQHLRDAAASGTHFALVSPLRNDLADGLPVDWYPVRPGTDVALMLALAHTLLTEDLADRAFLDRYTVGADVFAAEVLGERDGTVRDATWAAELTGIAAEEIRALARRMAAGRTLVTVTWSLQRTQFGEQPVWAAIALAALLGQIGLPGGGFGHGYGSMGDVGASQRATLLPTFPQGRNAVKAFIPVARIADLLLHPGETFDYDGGSYTYPDIRLVYWAGGNPFHHHQDLNRLRRALRRPDTVVVQEPYWTAMARHADVVLPATLPLERDDIGAGRRDTHLIAMHRALAPYGEARDDYSILAGVAERLGVGAEFTEGRTAGEWIEHLYEKWRQRLEWPMPKFDEFWAAGGAPLPTGDEELTLFEQFRLDPDTNPLRTPSGRIELHSATVAAFGYPDCPGHPTWLPSSVVTPDRRHPLVLIANQPTTRLHGQLDPGAVSLASKVDGREPVLINPADAAERGITGGDVVRLSNDRGACLAGAVVSEAVRPGVVQLATGAWFDPGVLADGTPACVHGNPNVLTEDVPTSRLAQACSGQHTVVQLAREPGPLPQVRVHEPPRFAPA